MLNPVLFALGDEPAVWLVIILGIGIVFLGLVCIIGMCYCMGLIVNKLVPEKQTESVPATPVATPASAPTATQSVAGGAIPNRQEILAAVCAAVAEEEGTDISAIRVISFKKV